MQKFSFNGFGHEKTRRGEDIQKAFRYNPNSKLYVNAITKKMILFRVRLRCIYNLHSKSPFVYKDSLKRRNGSTE